MKDVDVIWSLDKDRLKQLECGFSERKAAIDLVLERTKIDLLDELLSYGGLGQRKLSDVRDMLAHSLPPEVDDRRQGFQGVLFHVGA